MVRLDRTRFCLLAALTSVACGFFGHAHVVVVNKSVAELHNVVLTGHGFSVRLGSLPPAKTVEVLVRPHGESGVAGSFDVNGQHFTFPEEGYIEAHDAYRARVEIRPDFTVHVDTTIAEK